MMCILYYMCQSQYLYMHTISSNLSRPQQEVIAPKSLGCFSYFINYILYSTTIKHINMQKTVQVKTNLLDSRIIASLRINNPTSACQKSLASRCAMSFLHFNTTKQFLIQVTLGSTTTLCFYILFCGYWQANKKCDSLIV